MTDPRGSFRYGRQFLLLLLLAVLLLTVGDRLPIPGAIARFAVYGGLYSIVLAATLRAPVSVERGCCFVLCGALSSAANAAIGFEAGRLLSALPSAVVRTVVLSFCAGSGAAAYAWLVRFTWNLRLPAVALSAAVLGCLLAVLLVLALQLAPHAGGAWIALAWWFAFSLVLWYHERSEIVARR